VECEKKSGVVSDGSGVISEESGVINVEWSGFGGEWSVKCRVEWFRRGSINVEWSVIGEVGSCTAPYHVHVVAYTDKIAYRTDAILASAAMLYVCETG
jgi:hypothetical protein